jgi:tetratricopeptide (TPR) repeat protein
VSGIEKGPGGENDSGVSSSGAARPTSIWKVAIFTVVAACAPFLIAELVLYVIGVRPAAVEEDPYVGFSSYAPLFVEEKGPDGSTRLVTARTKLDYFNHQEFEASKPTDSTFRVFCLGGSTTHGRPYDDKTSFCGWLRALLPNADPSRRWELINAGGVSYASYRVAKLMEELIRYEPDLFVVYCGHNEFLERRTYASILEASETGLAVRGLLSRTRTFTVIRRVMNPDAGTGAPVAREDRAWLPGEVDTILEHTIGPEAYHRDDGLRQQVLAHYRYNLARMVRIARSAGVDIVFVTCASNLGDCSPFKSEHGDGLGDLGLERWESLFEQAARASENGEWAGALEALDEAASLDDRHAHLHFRRGEALRALGRMDEAKAAFGRARDEDVCPLRALTSMRDIVLEVARDHEAPVVDFVDYVARHSEHGIPGDGLFLDHVHPTIEGNRLLALEVFDALVRRDLVHPTAEWGEAALAAVVAEVEGGLDREAHAIALRNLSMVLGWAGKDDEAHRMAMRALELNEDDVPTFLHAGRNAEKLGHLEDAIDYYRRALAIDPNYAHAHFALGDVFAAQGKLERAVASYREAVRLKPDFAEVHTNLGNALADLGRSDEAIAEYEWALRIWPDHAGTHCNLAIEFKSIGKVEKSVRHYRAAIASDPALAQAHYGLAGALAMLGKPNEALDSYRETSRLDPANPAPYTRAAWILATNSSPQIRNPELAVQLATQAVRVAGAPDPYALDALAAAYAAAGRFESARQAARDALKAARARRSRRADGIAQRLALYEQGQRFVEPDRPAPTGSAE